MMTSPSNSSQLESCSASELLEISKESPSGHDCAVLQSVLVRDSTRVSVSERRTENAANEGKCGKDELFESHCKSMDCSEAVETSQSWGLFKYLSQWQSLPEVVGIAHTRNAQLMG